MHHNSKASTVQIVAGRTARLLSYTSDHLEPLLVSIQPIYMQGNVTPTAAPLAHMLFSGGEAGHHVDFDIGRGIAFGIAAQRVEIDIETTDVAGTGLVTLYSGIVTPGNGPPARLVRSFRFQATAAGAQTAMAIIPPFARSVEIVSTPEASAFIRFLSWPNVAGAPRAWSTGPQRLMLSGQDKYFTIENGTPVDTDITAVFDLHM